MDDLEVKERDPMELEEVEYKEYTGSIDKE